MRLEAHKTASPGRKVHGTFRYSRLAMPQGFDQFDRPAALLEETRLQPAFGIFTGTLGVLHDPAADAQFAPAAGDGQGPYRDIEARRELIVGGRSKPAQRAAIGAA